MKIRSVLVMAAGIVSAAVIALAVDGTACAENAPVPRDASVGIQKAHIYPPIDTAAADIKAALAEAQRTHKRVIVDFGGDWCPDCQVLNIYFHQSPNADLLAKYFVRVNVNVGRMDANKEIAEGYGVPLKGVPALAVLDGSGKVVYAQNREFADMRHLDSASLTAFLNQWKP
jgi:thiol:disulfide interchange protein